MQTHEESIKKIKASLSKTTAEESYIKQTEFNKRKVKLFGCIFGEPGMTEDQRN